MSPSPTCSSRFRVRRRARSKAWSHRPAEQVLDEIDGIEHVYSTSMPGMAVLTVQYLVGEDRTDAIVRLYSKIIPTRTGCRAGSVLAQPIVKPKGIDDVPIVTVTLWSEDPSQGAFELGQVAHAIEVRTQTRAGHARHLHHRRGRHVVAVRSRSAGAGLARARSARPAAWPCGRPISRATTSAFWPSTTELLVQAGVFLSHADEIGDLVVGRA